MIENQARFSGLDLRLIFKESNLININDSVETIGVSIDTRKIQEGNLFVPLKGENIDGNRLIEEAFNNGAKVSFVEKDYYYQNKENLSKFSLIIVDSSLSAIGLLANFHRKRFDIPMIAIGGSNGKTTTKEMISHILSANNKVLKTYKNYNNQLGVPLMLLSLDESYDIALLEIATNEPGEIAILSEILEPTHGLITNIGKEHLEKLIDIRGVEIEETFLFGQLRKFNKMSFINYDDPILSKYANLLETKYVFGQVDGLHLTYKVSLDKNLNPTLDIKTYNDKNFTVKLNGVFGKIQAYNAVAAIAIALELGEPIESIKKQISGFQSDSGSGYGRMLVEKIGNLTLINDCYNANPNSVSVALDTLDLFDGEKIAVLGDMLELGDKSIEEHKNILEKASKTASKVYLFGEIYGSIKLYQNCTHFVDKKEISNKILEENNNATILIKGSRGMKLEEIVNQLRK